MMSIYRNNLTPTHRPSFQGSDGGSHQSRFEGPVFPCIFSELACRTAQCLSFLCSNMEFLHLPVWISGRTPDKLDVSCDPFLLLLQVDVHQPHTKRRAEHRLLAHTRGKMNTPTKSREHDQVHVSHLRISDFFLTFLRHRLGRMATSACVTQAYMDGRRGVTMGESVKRNPKDLQHHNTTQFVWLDGKYIFRGSINHPNWVVLGHNTSRPPTSLPGYQGSDIGGGVDMNQILSIWRRARIR